MEKKPTQYIDPFEDKKRLACFKQHTKCPGDYLSWHAWAEEKSKTHLQVKCPGCGLYEIWVKSTLPVKYITKLSASSSNHPHMDTNDMRGGVWEKIKTPTTGRAGMSYYAVNYEQGRFSPRFSSAREVEEWLNNPTIEK